MPNHLADADLAREVVALIESGKVKHDQGVILRPVGDLPKVDLPDPRAVLRGETERYMACAAGMIFLLRSPEGAYVKGAGGTFSLPDQKYRIDLMVWANDQLHAAPGVGELIFYYSSNTAAVARLKYLADHPGASAEEIGRILP